MDYTALSKAVVDALTNIGGQITTNIGSVAPVALGIVGALMVISFGVRTFRSIAG
ncbi:hypothetical protein [Hespellia stercorisuis]|uniref:Uncharacterized protein n=1 Tax=Hespellia stercorisuis DSM 15480 TaxID=1121950 RepID=A0A1M6X106_9FIRM|nr:hypothetical protein [Hespellia stercorisuis]SHK99603.1 hypothetical protein SAMN02745243_04141 [Hespellia stercorisuis DSM 15480]